MYVKMCVLYSYICTYIFSCILFDFLMILAVLYIVLEIRISSLPMHQKNAYNYIYLDGGITLISY